MKLADIHSPVRYGWLAEQGLRLDAAPYLSGAVEARKLLERLSVPTEPLLALTRSAAGIFHPGRVPRRWVTDPEHGVPFFSSTDILEADSSYLPLIARGTVDDYPDLLIERDWTMITRSGTVGRLSYVRPDADGFACSEHVIRVVGDPDRILPGYLNAFLQSRFGVPIITSAAYGAIIQHIEPRHIADLPVPRFGDEVEGRIHALIQQAADLRARFQAGVRRATEDLFTSAGLPELIDYRWHDSPRDLAFPVAGLSTVSLRALNFAPRAQHTLARLRSVPHSTLGEICEGGQLSRINRFKRIDSSPEYGVRLLGQRQGFWLRPEGRWIALSSEDLAITRAIDEAIMIASQGTLGENEVFCRPLFVSGRWQREFVFSEHFLRVVSGVPRFSGAYLFAFLRSEPVFRLLRSMSTGSKQQDIHEVLRRHVPVPECTAGDRERIAETVRRAYRDRDEADMREDEAIRLLDEAVREAAG